MESLVLIARRYWEKGKRIGFFHLLTSNAVTKVLGVVFILAIARFLDAADVGRINIMLASMTVLTTLANFGTTTSILKLCSENVDIQVIEQHFVDGTVLNIVFSFVTFVAANLLVVLRLLTSDAVLIRLMPIFLLVVLTTTLNGYFFVYFQARQQIVFISKLQASLKLFSILVVILCTLVWQLKGFVLSYTVTDLASLLVYVAIVRKRVSQHRLNWNWTRVKQIFSLSKYGALANSLGQLLQYLDTMVLSVLRVDLSVIGHYSVAQYFLIGGNQLTYTMNQVAVPRLSFHSDNKVRWMSAYKEYERSFRLVTVATILMISVAGPFIILVFVGKAYTVAITYIFILLVGFGARGFMVPYSIAVWSLGRLDYNFFSSFMTALLNLVLNVSLVLMMGALGASCATSAAYILGIPIFRHYFFREVKRKSASEWDNVKGTVVGL